MNIIDTDPTSLGFRPRTLAELTSTQIDRGFLGTFTNRDVGTVGLDLQPKLRLAQQRYIAGALGLQVGATEIQASSHTANAAVSLPDLGNLPPLPTRRANGRFISAEGPPLPNVQVDAIYAGRFIAARTSFFSQAGIFEKLFGDVVEQAERGNIETKNSADPAGSGAMLRQVARVLGYEIGVGNFHKTTAGTYAMPVHGIKPGFDNKNTHFKL